MTDREPQTGESALRELRNLHDHAHYAMTWDECEVCGIIRAALATAQEPDTTEYERGRADALRDVGDALLAAPDDTRPASVAGLAEAWAEAEAALPDGWRMDSIERGIHDDDPWTAEAMFVSMTGDHGHIWGRGDTPAAALHALAQRLREHSDPGAAGEAGL